MSSVNTLIFKRVTRARGAPIRAAANTWSEHEVGLASGRTRNRIMRNS